MKEVDAIFFADVHLMEKTPINRVDDVFETQFKKLQFIKELQVKYNCPVYCSGDFFNNAKPSPHLLSRAIQAIPSNFHTVLGNHDLPYHNIELWYKCGVYVLYKAKKLEILNGMHFNSDYDDSYLIDVKGRKLLVIHIMTFANKEPYPGCTAPRARGLLRKYEKADVILTGDNHITFTETYKNRILVNPGSMLRTTIAQRNHKPSVFLYNAKNNEVEQLILPYDENALVEEDKATVEIEQVEIKEEEIKKLTDLLKSKKFSFGGNVTRLINAYFEKNKTVDEEVKQIILNNLE